MVLDDESPAYAGLRECAEEDSNLHPVIPDQALNLVTRVSDTSYASRTSDASTFLEGMDAMDAMDDLDVATDVATSAAASSASGATRVRER